MTTLSDDSPPLELRRLIETLNRYAVTYLVVGGANTVMQGADHVTTDLDVLPVAEESNLARLGAAMTELGARLRVSGLSDEEAKACRRNSSMVPCSTRHRSRTGEPMPVTST